MFLFHAYPPPPFFLSYCALWVGEEWGGGGGSFGWRLSNSVTALHNTIKGRRRWIGILGFDLWGGTERNGQKKWVAFVYRLFSGVVLASSCDWYRRSAHINVTWVDINYSTLLHVSTLRSHLQGERWILVEITEDMKQLLLRQVTCTLLGNLYRPCKS